MTKRKIKAIAILLILVLFSVFLTSCESLFGKDSERTDFKDKMESSTGKWQLLDDADTYFEFDGSEGAMTFGYYEDGALKFNGKFRANYNAADDASIPLSFNLTRSDKQSEDWLNCYVENFEMDFSQFTVIYEEEDLGVTDGTVYTHIYRISEMPYRLGTYILEGKNYKNYSKNLFDDGTYRIPEGTYVNESGQRLTVIPVINRSYLLFSYTNGDAVVEGVFNIAQDRKTIYLYIEHDIYEKVRESDKKDYDTTFSLNYPPDFYLRGNFDTDSNDIVVDGLYHHEYSPTEIEDSFWVFGTYVKQ